MTAVDAIDKTAIWIVQRDAGLAAAWNTLQARKALWHGQRVGKKVSSSRWYTRQEAQWIPLLKR